MPYKTETESKIRKYGVWIIAILLWWYYRGRLGFYTIDKADIRFLWFILIMALGIGTFASEKYKTKHVIWNNGSGSWINRPQFIGDWVIVSVGGVRGTILPELPDTDAVLVVPKKCYGEAGDQILITAKMEHAEVKDCPPQLWNALESNTFYNLNNLLFGISGERFIEERPELSIYEKNLKDTNERMYEMNEMLEGKRATFEKEIGFISRSAERMGKKPSFWQRMFGKSEGEGEYQSE